ncbi:hypothetical protein PSTT_14474 [Puccinia striiformis]|uniref:UBX domain-containing protein n=1 Tax=Puccinia striiformis TaxID=27350 RepID=A0A2S4UM54_9BASI|nr:hypothetical protein PSTT_14474 [Puccinia striiformis]
MPAIKSQIWSLSSSITGSSTDQARFFVDSAGGNLETALSTYFETAGTTNSGAPAAPDTAPVPIAPTGPTTLSGEAADEMPAEWKRPSAGSKKSTGRKPPRSGGITSFGDLSGSSRVRGISTMKDINSAAGMSGGGDMSEDDDDDEEGPTDLYAGGGRSGLNVQDPNQQSSGKAGGIVADILKKAKELAKMFLLSPLSMPHFRFLIEGLKECCLLPFHLRAGSAPPSSTANATTSRSAPFFQGSAQTLGSDQMPSRPVVPEPASRPARQKVFRTALPVPGNFGSDLEDDDDEDENHEEEEEVEKHLTFWKDGFSIEDGPLMSYDDPNNKEILDAINHGRAPLDLLGVRLNQRVTMRVQKRLTENYIPTTQTTIETIWRNCQHLRLTQTTIQPSMLFEVDNTLPTTGVQIRLSDGSRVVTRFNHTHTIGDIRRHIEFSNPALATRPYALQTTFPSRDLTDDNQTIKEAGLLSAVVVQRYL